MRKNSLLLFVSILSMWNTIVYSQNESITKNNFVQIADEIKRVMSGFHYNPEELASQEYLIIEKKMYQIAKEAKTKEEFITVFNELWKNGPFSHVSIQSSPMNADDMADYFDNLKVGDQSVSLAWKDKTPILKVNTMMGIDTYEAITKAYEEIYSNKATSLIIDLRNNPGGTFAIVPLIGHVIHEPLDAGVFVSNKWWNKNSHIPKSSDIKAFNPWRGWSLKSFWRDVQENPLIRVQFEPMTPYFDGQIYILTSQKSASATEFAIDALSRLENVTIIGEITAGELLSQKMFDLPEGLQLSLPIAEYYSSKTGKIEGKGVEPDIKIDENLALKKAMQLITEKQP